MLTALNLQNGLTFILALDFIGCGISIESYKVLILVSSDAYDLIEVLACFTNLLRMVA